MSSWYDAWADRYGDWSSGRHHPGRRWDRFALVGDQERVAGLLDVAGLRLEALYGGFAGEPLDDDSGEYVFVARR